MMKQNITSDVPYHSNKATMPEILEEMGRKMIIDAIEKENSTRKAAKFLGVTQSLLMRRIRKYNIQLEVEESKSFVK